MAWWSFKCPCVLFFHQGGGVYYQAEENEKETLILKKKRSYLKVLRKQLKTCLIELRVNEFLPQRITQEWVEKKNARGKKGDSTNKSKVQKEILSSRGVDWNRAVLQLPLGWGGTVQSQGLELCTNAMFKQ